MVQMVQIVNDDGEQQPKIGSSISENDNHNINPDESESFQWKSLSISQKLSSIIKNITVEPMLACFIMPSILEGMGIQNLGLEKACRVNKNYSTEICDNLMQQTFTKEIPEEIEVQTLVTYMNTWRFVIQASIPAILILFIGAWSDSTGKRKPCMIVPILGECCTSISLILSTYYFTQWPMEVLALTESLFSSFTGGWTCMLMAVYSYIAYHTTVKERTFRIGIIDVVVLASTTLGRAICGIMLKMVGFYGVFSTCLGLYIAALIYISFRINDNHTVRERETANKSKSKDVIHLKHIRDTFMVLFKTRKAKKRLQILLLMLVYIIVTGPIRGGDMLQYLYLRKQFQFDEVDYSIFSFYSITIQLLGVMFALRVLSKHFQINDCILAILACTSKICAYMVYAFAPDTKWLYLAPVVEFIGSTVITVMRSMATKIVEEDETGRINSLFGVCEVFLGLAYGPLYATFYVNTLEYLPGAIFILGASLTAPSILIFMYMYKLSKADEQSQEYEKSENIQNDHELLNLKSCKDID